MILNKSKILQATFIISVIVGNSSCKNSNLKETQDFVKARNYGNFDAHKNENDTHFLVNAAEINKEEIRLGQLAQQSGSVTFVKELGKMMVDAHTKSLADLTVLAKTKNISILLSKTNNGQADYQILNNKSGKAFDKAYIDMMVDEHKDAISLFETGYIGSIDFDVRAWATATLPGLRTNLDHSKICQKECSKTYSLIN